MSYMEDEETEQSTGRKWSWMTFGSIMVAGVGTIAGMLSEAMDEHVTYLAEREKMQEQAGRELEALITAVEKLPAEKATA